MQPHTVLFMYNTKQNTVTESTLFYRENCSASFIHNITNEKKWKSTRLHLFQFIICTDTTNYTALYRSQSDIKPLLIINH